MNQEDALLVPGLKTVVLVTLAFLAAVPLVAGPPPAGKTYYVASIGLATDNSEAYEIGVGCIRFTEHEVCDMGNDCGDWEMTSWGEPGPKQGEAIFMFQIIDDETGALIEMEGVARIDGKGRRSTIAAAAHAIEPISGTKINFGFVGREVRPGKCPELVEEFEAD